MRVFISHSSKDKPAVEVLAKWLSERGIEVWLDGWVIRAGDDIVAAINKGLDEADAGLIVFSDHSRDSRWVESETSYFTWARIEEGKVLIPVMASDGAWVPPLLRPLARRSIEEVEAIADALRTRSAGAPAAASKLGSDQIAAVRIVLERLDVGESRCGSSSARRSTAATSSWPARRAGAPAEQVSRRCSCRGAPEPRSRRARGPRLDFERSGSGFGSRVSAR